MDHIILVLMFDSRAALWLIEKRLWILVRAVAAAQFALRFICEVGAHVV